MDVAVAAGLAIGLTATAHVLLGRVNLGLADEGFLWYGVLRVAEGEIPIRDFFSYDPARYYWCAAWAPWFGDGVMGVRRALALVGGMGLLAGLLTARRLVPHAAALAPVGLVLLLWTFPRHKTVDIAASLVTVLALVRLIERPTLARHAAMGCVAGALGLVGRNHAAYAAIGSALAMAFLHLRARPPGRGRCWLAWTAGGVAGYAPMLVAFVAVPGLLHAYSDLLRAMLRHGTHVSLPVPWPWTVAYDALPASAALAAGGLGLGFLFIPAVCALGAVVLWRTPGAALRDRAVLLAATAVGLLYLHHALARADARHLAQAIHPALLASLALAPALLPSRPRLAGAGALASVLLLTAVVTPHYNEPLASRLGPLHRYQVAGEELLLDTHRHDYLRALATATAGIEPSDEVLIVPIHATLYPLLGKRSPIWSTFLLQPGDADTQAGMIAQLDGRAVVYVLVADAVPPQQAHLLFRNTHPIVWAHLIRNFEPVAAASLPRGHTLYRRRQPAQVEDAARV